MLRNGIADIVLRVRDQEFRADRHTLISRSPVFSAMLSPDIFVMHIDANPRTFSDFLNYLNTENMRNITSENVSELYMFADKYEVGRLKILCLNYMLENISVDNFCDVLSVAVLYLLNDLKEACFKFFARTARDIMMTVKWQIFCREHPGTSDELLIFFIRKADKYEVDSLKIICLNYMLENISVDNFCDVLSVALLDQLIDLREACFDFFVSRSREITLTPKWQIFCSEHPETSSELLTFLNWVTIR